MVWEETAATPTIIVALAVDNNDPPNGDDNPPDGDDSIV